MTRFEGFRSHGDDPRQQRWSWSPWAMRFARPNLMLGSCARYIEGWDLQFMDGTPIPEGWHEIMATARAGQGAGRTGRCLGAG